MEKSKVYFTDFRTKANGDGLPTKLKKLMKKAGPASTSMVNSLPLNCISAS